MLAISYGAISIKSSLRGPWVLSMSDDIQEIAKTGVDGISLVAAWSAVAGVLPPLAALASLIWTGIRIWEWSKGKKID